MSPKKHKEASLLPAAPLLITESRDQFDDICRALTDYIKPVDILEEILARDVVDLSWHILRLRRWKTAVVNKGFVPALVEIFTKIFEQDQDYLEANEQAEEIAHQWFTNQEVKEKGLKILRRLSLDESAIEAEAYSEAAPQIESLDKLLASAESRRNKTVRAIAEYRSGLAKRLEEASKRIIDGEALAIDNAPDANSEGA
jgi:hypothetical protein